MILSAFLMFPVQLGLAFGQLYPDQVSGVVQNEACPTQSSTSSQGEATIDIRSDLLNVSATIEFAIATIVTAITTCPTTQRSWSQSTAVSHQQPPLSISIWNKTFAGSNTSLTQGQYGNITFHPTTSQPSPTTVATSLIFDYGTAPHVSPWTVNASTLSGAASRYRLALSDSLVVLLAGAVQMGMA